MKIIILILLCSFLVCPAQEKKGLQGTIPAFSLEKNDLELSHLAQPSQYFDKIGKRAGVMGFESGMFEAWIWPWKPLRNFDLSFLLGTSTQPILGRDIARSIAVTPEATVITYTYESFTVKEIVLVPRNESGVILLLDVHNNVPLTIVAGFLPVMQPMWPAGVGGQFSYWDDDAHGYVISEGQYRAEFVCGSFAGKQMAAPPAHMFADNPLQFKIDIEPGEADGKFIPIVIAGGSKTKMDSVKTLFNRLATDAEQYYRANYDYYRQLRASTVQVTTPNPQFDLAFEWGKVALDNLLVTNPNLGTGLVAGFGLSGSGERPGFAWFFGGDAFINALSFDGYGAYNTVRDGLAFTQKWQRQEDFPIRKKKPDDVNKDIGKMSHELSQSDGLVDWWNDYHYGYNHADTTPWYLVAMGDYVRTSGDVDFLKKSWPSVKQAYQWCLNKDSDGDGLMDLKGAGLGALEFGKLVGIYADMYTCGVWVQGIKEMIAMAGIMNDDAMLSQAREQLTRGQAALEKKFWMEKEGFYTYGATEKGEQVKEKTPWVGTAIMFGLLDAGKTAKTLEALNGADICSDWGTRSLSPSSTLFDPTNYNYGAAWPFISSFFGVSQFRYGYSLSGYSTIESVVRHVFDNALGEVPEVFSGDINQKLAEGYHHQGFSTTGYMLPMTRGLFGLEINALQKSITFQPRVPADWHAYAVRNIRLGSEGYDLLLAQTDSSYRLTVASPGSESFTIHFQPDLPPGASIGKILVNNTPVAAGADHAFTFSGQVHNGDTIEIRHSIVATVLPSVLQTAPGASNYSLKVVSNALDGNKTNILRLVVEGRSGESYAMPLLHPELIGDVRGASITGDHLAVTFEKAVTPGFVRKEIFLTLK